MANLRMPPRSLSTSCSLVSLCQVLEQRPHRAALEPFQLFPGRQVPFSLLLTSVLLSSLLGRGQMKGALYSLPVTAHNSSFPCSRPEVPVKNIPPWGSPHFAPSPASSGGSRAELAQRGVTRLNPCSCRSRYLLSLFPRAKQWWFQHLLQPNTLFLQTLKLNLK